MSSLLKNDYFSGLIQAAQHDVQNKLEPSMAAPPHTKPGSTSHNAWDDILLAAQHSTAQHHIHAKHDPSNVPTRNAQSEVHNIVSGTTSCTCKHLQTWSCVSLPDSARSGTTRTMCLLYRLYRHTTSTLFACAHVIHHPELLCCLTD